MKINYSQVKLDSRLEIHFWSEFKNERNSEKKSFVLKKNTKVYVENFQNLSSLKSRVIESSQIWLDFCRGNSKNGEIQNEIDYGYPRFLILDSANNFGFISYTPQGWLPPINHFYGYVARYFAKVYGSKQYLDYLIPLKGKKIKFKDCNWELRHIDEIELVSEKLLDILLTKFLEPNKISLKTFNQACYQEMVERGYIDILNNS